MRKESLKFVGFPEHEIYENGLVQSIDRIIITKNNKKRKLKSKRISVKVGNQGYPHLTINSNGKLKGFSLHRLLALAFIYNPNNYPCVNHKDGNKENNCLNNLEWCTHVKNIRHAYRTGLTPIRKGFDSKSSKLNLDKIDKILKIVKETQLSYKEIGKKFNVSSSCIGDIVKGKVWNNNKFSIQDLEDFINSNSLQTTQELIIKLKENYGK